MRDIQAICEKRNQAARRCHAVQTEHHQLQQEQQRLGGLAPSVPGADGDGEDGEQHAAAARIAALARGAVGRRQSKQLRSVLEMQKQFELEQLTQKANQGSAQVIQRSWRCAAARRRGLADVDGVRARVVEKREGLCLLPAKRRSEETGAGLRLALFSAA